MALRSMQANCFGIGMEILLACAALDQRGQGVLSHSSKNPEFMCRDLPIDFSVS